MTLNLVVYQPGEQLVIADALSRVPSESPAVEDESLDLYMYKGSWPYIIAGKTVVSWRLLRRATK